MLPDEVAAIGQLDAALRAHDQQAFTRALLRFEPNRAETIAKERIARLPPKDQDWWHAPCECWQPRPCLYHPN